MGVRGLETLLEPREQRILSEVHGEMNIDGRKLDFRDLYNVGGKRRQARVGKKMKVSARLKNKQGTKESPKTYISNM